MVLLAYLDRQHAGKPGSIYDRGAWGDLDGNGRQEVEEAEAILTARYLLAAEQALIKASAAVLPISDGTYVERHLRVARYAAFHPTKKQVYVAAHLNAGGGSYGAVFFDRRSRLGEIAAECVARALRKVVPDVRVMTSSSGVSARAWSTIAGLWPSRACGICFEPYFLDAEDSCERLNEKGLTAIGQALAAGLLDWARLT